MRGMAPMSAWPPSLARCATTLGYCGAGAAGGPIPCVPGLVGSFFPSLSLALKCSACTSSRGETYLDSLDTLETFTAFMLRVSEYNSGMRQVFHLPDGVKPARSRVTNDIRNRIWSPKSWNSFLLHTHTHNIISNAQSKKRQFLPKYI